MATASTTMQIRDRVKELRRVKAGDLIANPKNWRKHPKEQAAALRGLLDEVGYADALLVRETPGGLMLIDGHLRAETTPDAVVPVLILDVTEAEADKLLATLDPLAAMAESDVDALDSLIAEVDTDSDGLQELLDSLASTPEAKADDPPESPPAEPVTQVGDLWILGEHRLLCGNSNDPRDIAALCPEMRWDVSVVDPPYEASVKAWLKWIMDPCIVFGQAKQLRLIPDHLWRFERVIVKTYRHRTASTQIAQRHALVAQCGTVRTLPRNKKATLDSVVQQELDTEHDHQKPVSLLVEHLTHWTPSWKTVIDPFAGSGSTILAAEQMGKRCVAVEIDPGWCDVIVARWEKSSGKSAQRVERERVESYNTGTADVDAPAAPKRRRAKKEQAHV